MKLKDKKIDVQGVHMFLTNTGTAKRKPLPLRPCGRISVSFPGMKYTA